MTYGFVDNDQPLRRQVVEPSSNVRRRNIVTAENGGFEAPWVCGAPSFVISLGNEPNKQQSRRVLDVHDLGRHPDFWLEGSYPGHQ
jgi:hypothetical protein